MECTIPRKHHRHVLGTKGTNVQEITQQHNVSVKFPDREETEQVQVTDGETDPRDVIVITGRKENCEAAKQALLVSSNVFNLITTIHSNIFIKLPTAFQ